MTEVARLSFPSSLADRLRQSPCDIVVTGGGGWIGQAVLEMLESAFGDELVRRVAVFGSSARDLKLRSGRVMRSLELTRIDALDDKPKLFVHCAFLTKDKLADQSVESFVAANRKISDLIAAAIQKSDARGIFMPSSGAVYNRASLPQARGAGEGTARNNNVAELRHAPLPNQPSASDPFGSKPREGEGTHLPRTLDDDLQTNAYGVMKIADEKRFSEIAARKSMPISVPRLFNLSGPFINKIELYALASMIKAVQDGRPISIRAAHRVVRSYIHVADLATLGFSMLLEPRSDDQPIFDTVGDDVLELSDLAEHIRAALGQPTLAIERPARSEGHDDIYVGDGEAMRRMMRSRGLTLRTLAEQIRDTADYLKSL